MLRIHGDTGKSVILSDIQAVHDDSFVVQYVKNHEEVSSDEQHYRLDGLHRGLYCLHPHRRSYRVVVGLRRVYSHGKQTASGPSPGSTFVPNHRASVLDVLLG